MPDCRFEGLLGVLIQKRDCVFIFSLTIFSLWVISIYLLSVSFQVLEYDTPEVLLQKEETAFSRMVQSTGAANAQYLRNLVLGGEEGNSVGRDKQLDGQRRWLASSRWTAAAQFALAVTLTSSQNDLVQLEIEDEDNILKKTKNAVITLQGVLEGKHDKEIEDTLDQYQVSRDRWWSSLYKMVEGKDYCKLNFSKAKNYFHGHLL